MTQAIETKFLGATNNKPSRVKATAWAGSITLSYDHALNTDQNHAKAAMALVEKLGWDGPWLQGASPKGSGYVFVLDCAINRVKHILEGAE